mmetsp:Transcript_19127/g.52737  ORF Transcript_19127/g.52737 Transcript_19127/m.52737 type:complete len:207 (+) Transcript_19127:1-621(+)
MGLPHRALARGILRRRRRRRQPEDPRRGRQPDQRGQRQQVHRVVRPGVLRVQRGNGAVRLLGAQQRAGAGADAVALRPGTTAWGGCRIGWGVGRWIGGHAPARAPSKLASGRPLRRDSGIWRALCGIGCGARRRFCVSSAAGICRGGGGSSCTGGGPPQLSGAPSLTGVLPRGCFQGSSSGLVGGRCRATLTGDCWCQLCKGKAVL